MHMLFNINQQFEHKDIDLQCRKSRQFLIVLNKKSNGFPPPLLFLINNHFLLTALKWRKVTDYHSSSLVATEKTVMHIDPHQTHINQERNRVVLQIIVGPLMPNHSRRAH